MALQQQRNDALEWTKALAPTVGNLVSGLGVAAINASVTKNAQDANRDIIFGDQQQNARIVSRQLLDWLMTLWARAVLMWAGDYYVVSDDRHLLDQSTNTTTTTTTTSTETNTTTTTTSGDTIDDNSANTSYVTSLMRMK